MINKEKLKEVTELWQRGAEEFGFKLEMPFKVIINGKEKEYFAWIKDHGNKNGTLIYLIPDLHAKIDGDLVDWAKNNNYLISIMHADGDLSYDANFISDCLEDWGPAR